MAEPASAPSEPTDCDVGIVGGGLAGLTLALQLRQAHPALRVRVLERRDGPAPEAAHKVGESTVEIGAHYFAQVLGLRQHLESAHLKKFGFRFFFNDGADNLALCPELGPSQYLSVPTYQIDRGVFENHLADEAARRGIQVMPGARVLGCALDAGGGPHRVRWRDAAGTEQQLGCRWLVDASGRAGLLKRQLGLARGNGHAAFSVWFRVRGHVRPDDWGQVGAGDPAAWRTRCGVGQRWLSTNHLCGPGYWVWLIPLASGCHSVGIVADPAQHDFEAMKTHAGAMRWLARHQPQLHAALAASAEPPLDFGFLRSFSHDARQLFSHQRWALVGEAGRFLDPFYSPGSDFIAIGNTYVTELVGIDLGGGDLRPAARLFDAVFRSFYDNMLPLYENQYALFGNAAAMSHKVVWDYTYYWSVLAPLFFHGRLADTALLAECAAPMQACAQLNQGMQDWLRAAAEQRGERLPRAPAFQDHTQIHWFRTLNTRLTQPAARADVARQMHEAPQVMATLAQQALQRFGPAEHAPEAAHHARLAALCAQQQRLAGTMAACG
ncbi:MAG TPA: NAD(P)/FAD-dependent oxidoreductase [Ottowia sp.]|nr:NAD(P)/FAD-dependent oxidoreductase [Ottowia sp.]